MQLAVLIDGMVADWHNPHFLRLLIATFVELARAVYGPLLPATAELRQCRQLSWVQSTVRRRGRDSRI
jgi:hypothetical protein